MTTDTSAEAFASQIIDMFKKCFEPPLSDIKHVDLAALIKARDAELARGKGDAGELKEPARQLAMKLCNSNVNGWAYSHNNSLQLIQDAFTRILTAPSSAPEGFAVVPLKPTEAMLIAGDHAGFWAGDKYKAMIAAAMAENIKRWMQFPDSDYIAPAIVPPGGFKLVPLRPTDEMHEAGMRAFNRGLPGARLPDAVDECYKAMIAATKAGA